ncbi:cingulin isoform X2 [Notechis scutatus]|nr:cingulin isoform X2 [Notechis scutatus]XP_026543727.1 cingulin isoform X2 [Notechis scutatus]
MDYSVNGTLAEKHSPIDYGVQIRFIDDLKEPRKPQKVRPKAGKPGSYGVAVRVQGIDGQPFVVLNSGEKGGDSFGVQIKGGNKYERPAQGQTFEETFPGSPRVGSSSKDISGSISSDSDLPENPYGAKPSRYGSHYSTSDEEPGLQRVPQADSLDGIRVSRTNPSSASHSGYRTLPHKKSMGQQHLRRTQSHSSLLDPESSDPQEKNHSRTHNSGYSSRTSPSGIPERGTGARNPSPPRVPNLREPTTTNFSGLRTVSKPAPSDTDSPEPTQAIRTNNGDIDTKPLSSVDSLIHKFDGRPPPRGRASRRTRVSPESHQRSRSLDARGAYRDTADGREREIDRPHPGHFKEVEQSLATKPLVSANAPGSRGAAGSQAMKEKEVDKSKMIQDWVNKSLEEPGTEKQTRKPQSDLQLKSTPDLLRDQQEVAQPGSTEYTKELIYSILKDRSTESDATAKRKTNLVFEKIQAFAAIPSSELRGSSTEMTEPKTKVDEPDSRTKGSRSLPRHLQIRLEELEEECRRLREAFEKKSQELQSTGKELRDVRAVKEQLEAKLTDLEDQLTEMQKALDRFQELSGSPDQDALLKELLETREDLEAILTAKQKQEDQLRQRERELTALKGALKEEVASHDQELDRVRQQYQQDMEQLRRNMDDVSQDQASLEAERQKVNSLVRTLQTELQESQEEAAHWKEVSQRNKEELRSVKQELMQVKVEREEFEEDLKESRERSAALRKEMDQIRSCSTDAEELHEIRKELRQAREQLQDMVEEKEDQHKVLRLRESEIFDLKEKLKDEVASRSQDLQGLNLRFQEKMQQLQKDYEEAFKTKAALEGEKGAIEQSRKLVESTLRETQEENDDLRRKILGLETQLKEYHHFADSWQDVETRLKEKIFKLEADRKQMEESVNNAVDQEQDLLLANRSLESRLEEAQRNLNRLTVEHQDLSTSYQEELKQKEALRRAKNELEEEKRLLDRSIVKLTKELKQMAEESRQGLSDLQRQLEEYKEKSRKEISDSQKQAKDRNGEVEKMQYELGRCQDEVLRLKQALQDSQAERENALLDKELLAQRLRNLEQEMETKRRSQDDRSRQVKALEDKSKRLEVELDEERNAAELLTERINRSRDQIDQLRAELLQERSVRQDLECDKVALERQNKDLKSRLTSNEGLQKSSANVSQLESRIQELQEKLLVEEREKTVLLSSNRKLERKMKEVSIQIDEERQHVNDQKDQLSLRVKALKRQVDEAEEEIERLEAARKKALRELEEQHETNEQLQSRVKALEKDLWRKAARSTAESSLRDDQLSSDEEFDSAYGPSSIASLLTEGNLQTSSC